MSKDRLKQPISPLSEVGFEKFLDNNMKNYMGKFKVTMWNCFDSDCKNK